MTHRALIEIYHHLEKLEFALGFILLLRSDQIKVKIKTIGFRHKEPVT